MDRSETVRSDQTRVAHVQTQTQRDEQWKSCPLPSPCVCPLRALTHLEQRLLLFMSALCPRAALCGSRPATVRVLLRALPLLLFLLLLAVGHATQTDQDPVRACIGIGPGSTIGWNTALTAPLPCPRSSADRPRRAGRPRPTCGRAGLYVFDAYVKCGAGMDPCSPLCPRRLKTVTHTQLGPADSRQRICG